MTFQELKEMLVPMAIDGQAWDDDPEFMPCDYAGGNIDDAYNGGVNDGRIHLAREILAKMEA